MTEGEDRTADGPLAADPGDRTIRPGIGRRPAAPRGRSKVLGMILRVAIGLGLLGLAIRMNRSEIQGVLDRRPDPLGFALGLTFYLSGLMFAYLRWYLIVRTLGLAFRYRDAVRLGLIGALFNFVIPGAVVGNAVRAAFLCRERPDQKPRAVASVVVDFLAGLLGLFLIAAIVGTLGWSRLDPRVNVFVIVAWGGVLSAIVPLYASFRPRRSRRPLPGAAFRQRPAVIPLAVLMGTGTHALNVLAFHSVSVAMYGASVPGLAEHFLIVPLVLFTTAVPLPFGALGVSEQASAGLFGMMGYRNGAVAMLGFRLLQFAGAAIGAGVYVMNAREVRRLAAEPPSSP